MGALSTNKLGALALVVGPALAFIMYLIQPGGLLIGPVEASDTSGLAAVMSAHSGLARISAVVLAASLMVLAFGIYEVHVAHRGSRGDGLNMAGLGFVTLGVVAWVVAQGLVLPLANGTSSATALEAVAVIRQSIVLLGGLGASLGFLLFSLGVAADSDSRWFVVATWVAALASVVGLAGWGLAIAGPDTLDDGTRIARSVYIIWTVWLTVLGVRLWREEVGTSAAG